MLMLRVLRFVLCRNKSHRSLEEKMHFYARSGSGSREFWPLRGRTKL
jgi:hypothetical protein